MTNSRAGKVIGSIAKNAVPINGLVNTSKNPSVARTYGMAAYLQEGPGSSNPNRAFVVVLTVEQHTGNAISVDLYDVGHSINGRIQKSSLVGTKPQGVTPSKAATISIADFLEVVESIPKFV